MKSVIGVLFAAVTILTAGTVVAAEQTAKLKVENMYCAACPFIVKQTLTRVEGVKDVDVSYQRREAVLTATVSYDDQYCSVGKLANAVAQAGFPAEPVTE